jgi:hypothetical protein
MKKIIIINLDLQISEIYYNLAEAFNSSKADKLLSYYKDNLEINLKSDTKLFFKLLYKFSENEYESLYKYLNNSLTSEFIQLL